MQVKFKFNEKITETFAENTFGILRREINPDWSVSKNIPVPKGEELKTNTAPMQRFAWNQGLGVITEGLNEFGADDRELYVTILRSVCKLSKLSLNTRNFPAGPPLDTPEAQCLGKQTVKYALCSTENPSDLFKESDEFFGNIIADIGSNSNNTATTAKTFLKTDNANIYTYAVKSSENSDGIVFRMMNLSNEIQHVYMQTDLSFSSYAEINGLEEIISKPENFEKKLEFKPYELKNIIFKKA